MLIFYVCVIVLIIEVILLNKIDFLLIKYIKWEFDVNCAVK